MCLIIRIHINIHTKLENLRHSSLKTQINIFFGHKHKTNTKIYRSIYDLITAPMPPASTPYVLINKNLCTLINFQHKPLSHKERKQGEKNQSRQWFQKQQSNPKSTRQCKRYEISYKPLFCINFNSISKLLILVYIISLISNIC